MLNKKNRGGVLLIPFAYNSDFKTGVNVNRDSAYDIYMKNLVVSAISAKNNGGCNLTVVVATNISIPQNIKELLENNNIEIVNEDFDVFTFDNKIDWGLAFYKLCAIYKFAREYEFEYYSYADTDVYIQKAYDDIFKECDQNILLYDINHGLSTTDYNILLEELCAYYKSSKLITHYGGEFFAANRQNTLIFTERCLEIYKKMINESITTSKGDEFILSIAADELKSIVKNGGAYIYRYWTSQGMRLVSTNYKLNSIVILHMPNEKNHGILRIFNYYKKGKKISNKKVWHLCHLNRNSFITRFRYFMSALIYGKRKA